MTDQERMLEEYRASHADEPYLGIDPVPGDTRLLCPAKLNVMGGDFSCDYVREHEGWAHSSKAAQAIWVCS